MLQGYEVKFNLYAEDESEADEARIAIVNFIRQHAQHGRAVTARKVADAVNGWERNPIIKNGIIKYFS